MRTEQPRSFSNETTRPLRPRRATLELEEGNFAAPSSSAPTDQNTRDSSSSDANSPGALIERFAPEKKRPHHRLGLWGLRGKKVDTIEWCKVC